MAFLLAVPQAVGSYTSGVPVPQVSPQGLCEEHSTVPDVGILDDSGPRDIGVRKYPSLVALIKSSLAAAVLARGLAAD